MPLYSKLIKNLTPITSALTLHISSNRRPVSLNARPSRQPFIDSHYLFLSHVQLVETFQKVCGLYVRINPHRKSTKTFYVHSLSQLIAVSISKRCQLVIDFTVEYTEKTIHIQEVVAAINRM